MEKGVKPSMHVSNWATIRFSISLWAVSRFGTMASISSMKMIQGALVCTHQKTKKQWMKHIRKFRMVSGQLHVGTQRYLCICKKVPQFRLRLATHATDNLWSTNLQKRDIQLLRGGRRGRIHQPQDFSFQTKPTVARKYRLKYHVLLQCSAPRGSFRSRGGHVTRYHEGALPPSECRSPDASWVSGIPKALECATHRIW